LNHCYLTLLNRLQNFFRPRSPPAVLSTTVNYSPQPTHPYSTTTPAARLGLPPSSPLPSRTPPYRQTPSRQHTSLQHIQQRLQLSSASPSPSPRLIFDAPSAAPQPLLLDFDDSSSQDEAVTPVPAQYLKTNKPTPTAVLNSFIQVTGLSVQQTKKHIALLSHLQTLLLSMSPQTAILRFISEINNIPNPVSTKLNHMGSLIGAITRSSLYLPSLPPVPVQLLRDAAGKLQTDLMIVRNFDLPGITPTQLNGVLNCLQGPSRLYLALMFRSAHRSTSILHLRRKDVKLKHHTFANDLSVTVRFRQGKTARRTDVYSVTIAITRDEIAIVTQLINAKHEYFFGALRHQYSRLVSATLKQHHFDVRSVRRGALRHLAQLGHDPEQLRLLSRHTTNAAVYQYVGAGLHLRSEAAKQLQLSKNLL